MATTTYIVPVDPQKPEPSLQGVKELDAAKLWARAVSGDKPAKVGTTRVFFGSPSEQEATALVSLGEDFASKTGDMRRELVRKAVGSAVKDVKGKTEGTAEAQVHASEDPHAAAVAAHLALYKFSLKTSPPSPFKPDLQEPVPEKLQFKPLKESEDWTTGTIYAKAQNLSRTLAELPANIMTPTAFTERVKAEFSGIHNVEIIVRDEAWAAEKGMRTFLSVTKGTSEPARFLEIHYTGAAKDARPLAMVGKGITFDSGGISLKPGAGMKLMRGDMGGAASVVSSVLAMAQLQLPLNVVAVTPLCENMPGPSANKPGDIVYAMNGKSVEIDNTDAEGRLILSDALYYASTTFNPHTLLDVATLTGAMDVALGEIFTGVFTSSDSLWSELHRAGEAEYDRFWRMPLDEDFGPQIYSSNADLCNTGGKPGGSCTAALFLKAFVEGAETKDGKEPSLRWAHIDMAGTMEVTRATPYMETGMSGRPVRALIEFARRLAQQ